MCRDTHTAANSESRKRLAEAAERLAERENVVAEALREIEDWATSDLDTGDVIGTVSEAAMFKVGYVAAQSEVLGLLLPEHGGAS